MRIAALFVIVLGGSLLLAQQSPKVNKIPVKPVPAESGKDMFRAYCASCHGMDGKGDGPAAPSLKSQPTDLTQLAHKNGGKYPSLTVVNALRDGATSAHGSQDMPVWGPILRSVSPNGAPVVHQRISNISDYVGSLQEK